MAAYVAAAYVAVDPQEDLPGAKEVDDGKVSGPSAKEKEKEVALKEGGSREDEPLLNNNKDLYECRICQDEDIVSNLETPCGCRGSLKYAHRKCVQYWCNEKGDTTCEICHKPYQPGYTAPPRPAREETAINIHRLAINVHPSHMDLNDPRLLTMPEVDRRYLETEYDEYPNGGVDTSGAELCRSATFILLAILLLRHIFVAGDNGSDDADDDFDLLTFFGLFFLKVAAFLLPCYIMAWTITLISRRREREAEEAAAAAPFALVLQSAHAGDLHLTIASPPQPAPPQEAQSNVQN